MAKNSIQVESTENFSIENMIDDLVKKATVAKDAMLNLNQEEMNICEILVTVGFASSKGEAKRMIAQKGVKLDSEVVEEIGTMVKLDEEKILQFGKNKFVKIVK